MTTLVPETAHEPLRGAPWNEGRVRDVIAAIAADAEARFSPDDLWPTHPLDQEGGLAERGLTSIYFHLEQRPARERTGSLPRHGGKRLRLPQAVRPNQDPRWLERARAFAMHAIEQWRQASATHRRGRYTLFTGDLGLAVFLWGAITADAAMPIVDLPLFRFHGVRLS